jgi:hypothetical protein
MKRILLLAFSLVLVAGCASRGCGGAQEITMVPATGVRVHVINAEAEPILSRIAIFGAREDGVYSRKVTEAWSRPGADTLILLEAGEYLVRAQGTGDSFGESRVRVIAHDVAEVKIGFGSLMLDGAALMSPGRVRVWQASEAAAERVVVTRLVRVGESPKLFLAQGNYRLAFLPDGAADESALWQPLGEASVTAGQGQAVLVKPSDR